MSGSRAVALYIDPPSHHFLGDRLFDPETTPLAGENIRAPYVAVRDGHLRATVHIYNDEDDVDRLLAALQDP